MASSRCRVRWLPAAFPLLALLATSCDRPQPYEIAPTLRLFEVRLSSTATYAPCADPAMDRLAVVACAERPPLVPGAEDGGTVTRGGGLALADRSAEELNENGRRLLAYADDPDALDRALAALQAAADLAPTAAHLNDLAAGHYVHAQLTGSAIHLVYALDAVERAYALAPDDSAVAFNRALARDRLHLLDGAREAWDDYLAIDAVSEWAVEARARRAAIPSEEPVGESATATESDAEKLRTEIQERLLGEWARLADPDPERAASLLREGNRLARRLAETTGDRLLLDTVRGIAVDRADPVRLQAQAHAHRLYAEASASLADRVPGTGALARRAVAGFDSLGSPFAGWARLLLVRQTYRAQRFDEVERWAGEILAALPADEAPSALRGRTLAVLGSARFADSRFASAADALRRALREFEALGERVNAARTLATQSSVREWAGDPTGAWRLRHDALSRLRRLDSPANRRLIFLNAAFFAAERHSVAARVFIDEAVLLAEREGAPIARVSAYRERAKIRRLTGSDGIGEDLERAEQATDSLESPDREINRALVLAERGRWLAARDPEQARAVLAVAVRLQREFAPLLIPEILLDLARAERRSGDLVAATRSVREAILELDRQRDGATGERERLSLAESAAGAYRESVELHLAAGDPDGALVDLERSRARRLRAGGDVVTREPAEARERLASLAARLPPDTAVVTWALLEDELVVWAWNSDGGEVRRRAVGREEVARRVAETRDAILDRDSQERERLAGLYRLLLAPVAGRLAGRTRLIVAPDGALHRIPFAALTTADGRYLVEDFEISRVLSLLAPRGESAKTPAPPLRSILSLVDPAFDTGLHPELSRLFAANREGSGIASRYAEPTVLRNAEATAAAFIAGLDDYDVVHVGAHGIDYPRDPFSAHLVLAPSGDQDGLLAVRDLLGVKAGQARLVVLAACESAGTRVTQSEGPLGLAWPLLANGVETVVATLWKVTDESSADFFVRFHRGVAAGRSPETALRKVQLEKLQEGWGVRDWGASVVFSRGTRYD